MSNWFMKEPCRHCPFRRDVRPFLHPERAEELAYMTENQYSEFYCHKTIEFDDDGDVFATGKSLTCAGFLSMKCGYSIETPDGFEPSKLVYADAAEMADAYDEEWNRRRKPAELLGEA